MQPTLPTSPSFLIAPEAASTLDTQPAHANETLVYRNVVFTFVPTCFGSLSAPLMPIHYCWGGGLSVACVHIVSSTCSDSTRRTHASESLTSGAHLRLQQTDPSCSFSSDPPHPSPGSSVKIRQVCTPPAHTYRSVGSLQ